ncbi:MAG: hypothetical protein QX196_11725 [Methylococcaceae bacterium]
MFYNNSLILDFEETQRQQALGVGRNKTTQACPELVEGRSAWWRFRHPRTGCRKRSTRLRLKSLIPAYSYWPLCYWLSGIYKVKIRKLED